MKATFTAACVLAAGMFLWGRPAVSGPADPEWAGPVLTDSEAVEDAMAASDEVARLDSRVAARQKKVDRAPFNLRNPELRVQDISTEYANPLANHQFQIGLRFRLPEYGEVNELVATARLEFWDAKVDAFVYRNDLATNVRLAWLDVVFGGLLSDLAARRVALAERQLQVIGRLIELGQAPFVRKVKAQTALLRARRDAAEARSALDAARGRLGTLTGSAGPVDATGYSTPEGNPDYQTLLAMAQKHRPEFEFEQQRLDLARTERRADELKMIPNFSFVEAAYHYESLGDDWGELSFGIELPLFNWIRGKPLEINDGGGRETRSFAGTEEVSADIGEEFYRYSAARGAWLALTDEAYSAGEDIRLLVEQARGQSVPEDDVLELEMAALDLEEMTLEAERDYAVGFFRLCGAVGVDDCGILLQGGAVAP